MMNPRPAPRQYSGWRLVLWGGVAILAGVSIAAILWITNLNFGTTTPFLAIGLVIGGLIFTGIGLVHVISGKPYVDDSNVHRAFKAEQRKALLEQQKRSSEQGR
ncbi:hypothetical protein [Subtercola boreus]|uniref:hypothetical protein n=1 Tax=Subtercola boreus TaxID=120213 RepID=UPI0011C037F2|nr:hypothetical protein [Subtercola boreus]